MWADNYVAKLNNGETVQFRPRGNSMKGKIDSGSLCTISPDKSDLKPGDIVLCRVAGSQYVHLILAIKADRFQIGNNHGGINGWIGINAIYGKLIKVEK